MRSDNLPLQCLERDARYAVIGLGATGLSCARFLHKRVDSLVLLDSRSQPPNVDKVLREFKNVDVVLGELDTKVLSGADFLLVSPGVALEEDAIAKAIDSGVQLLSDLDLFRMEVNCPIVCITGSNGKSTVATLVQQMALGCGRFSILCGNIGLPVLDALDKDAELYVVEVSSFQLERSRPLQASAATVLNVSPDHMDRYDSFDAYACAKARIYEGASVCVFNRADKATIPKSANRAVSFGGGQAANDDFGIVNEGFETHLCRGRFKLIDASAMRLKGLHNQLNALAAMALANAVGLDLKQCAKAACEFPGLEHRCEFVGSILGVDFVNDSKGTNTGATLAAIEGLSAGESRNIILLAGGVGKDADFSVLATCVRKAVKQAILFGQDAEAIAIALQSETETQLVDSIEDAVGVALNMADPGDIVLLSPACASFDMFDGFEHRGDHYKACVQSAIASQAQQ